MLIPIVISHLLCTCLCVPLPHAVVTSIVKKVYDQAKADGTHCCDVRDDHTNLLAIGNRFGRKLGVVYGTFLHGLYEPDAQDHCSKVLGRASSLEKVKGYLTEGLQAARDYKGCKQFPYQWLKNGDIYWAQLMSFVDIIWEFAEEVTTGKRSWCQLDSCFPEDCGPYSLGCIRGKHRNCKYMRRHLTRWITIFLHGHTHPVTRLCWQLATKKMGSGPSTAASLLQCEDFNRAQQLCNILQARHGRRTKFTLHDLTVLLCFNVSLIKSLVSLAKSRCRERRGKGVQKKV